MVGICSFFCLFRNKFDFWVLILLLSSVECKTCNNNILGGGGFCRLHSYDACYIFISRSLQTEYTRQVLATFHAVSFNFFLPCSLWSLFVGSLCALFAVVLIRANYTINYFQLNYPLNWIRLSNALYDQLSNNSILLIVAEYIYVFYVVHINAYLPGKFVDWFHTKLKLLHKSAIIWMKCLGYMLNVPNQVNWAVNKKKNWQIKIFLNNVKCVGSWKELYGSFGLPGWLFTGSSGCLITFDY